MVVAMALFGGDIEVHPRSYCSLILDLLVFLLANSKKLPLMIFALLLRIRWRGLYILYTAQRCT